VMSFQEWRRGSLIFNSFQSRKKYRFVSPPCNFFKTQLINNSTIAGEAWNAVLHGSRALRSRLEMPHHSHRGVKLTILLMLTEFQGNLCPSHLTCGLLGVSFTNLRPGFLLLLLHLWKHCKGQSFETVKQGIADSKHEL
jgi:hypothetical protein